MWQVSSFGRCVDSRGIITYGCRTPSGYHDVRIKGYKFRVHRLVALAFLGPPPNRMAWQVHHQDGDRSNNRVDNLEWVTPSGNAHYSHQNPLRGSAGPLQSKPVRWRKFGSKDWINSGSAKEAAMLAGVSRRTIYNCCKSGKPATDLEFSFVREVVQELVGEEWRSMLDPKSGMQVPCRMVSSMGRVTFQDGRVSVGKERPEGYFSTQLFLGPGHTVRCEYIHRIVAFTFLGPPPSPLRSQVNHKDLDKGNNAVENLEWSSASENLAHRWAKGTRNRSYGKAVESRLRGSRDDWERHSSLAGAAEVLQVHRSGISSCIAGRYGQTGGYEFRLAQQAEPDLLPGEEWKVIDFEALYRDRLPRVRA